ncbi:siderophore biosynthesis protein [Sutcliffiella horikoshii]|uniref:Siderophore biosynthesis protein n=1 Tax=Sutcliffiella horikoshii TaxID=79883 RepID=A0AA94WPF9_9BACI|nr:IucA/IucC family protein [Sutcliffiella horikoshii]TYS57822.1 siderophore biosynthesis protein [Sutcliffiella horikoshii]
MHNSAKKIAENASYQAFMNCYIREVGDVNWVKKNDLVKLFKLPYILNGEDVLELVLPLQHKRLIIEVNYRSLVGKHKLGRVYRSHDKELEWIEEEPLNCMITCIQELNLQARNNECKEMTSHYDELILRLIDSYHTICTYLEKSTSKYNHNKVEEYSFLESEQSLIFGHWLHPTPKSRQGMATWQHDLYAPELKGSFQLHYFEVDKSILKERFFSGEDSSIVNNEILDITREGKYLFPMHPLQAQWLLQQDYVQKSFEASLIKYVGPMGKTFSATSSIRTVYNKEDKWMYKFSIPVKVTNSMRVNKVHELEAGVVMAELFDKIDFLPKHNSFRVLHDPISFSLNLPGRNENGFEVIMRSNPFQEGNDRGVHSIAALVQDPLPGEESFIEKLIQNISRTYRISLEEASLQWFQKYWHCSVEPMIELYDEYGLALEAHQQNSLVDISNSFPSHYYFRDNQGYYLSNSKRSMLEKMVVNLKNAPELFYEEEIIQHRFTYYLFINHIFSIIYRMGEDGLIAEDKLVHWMIKELQKLGKRLSGEGKRFVHFILNSKVLPCKANLLTRFHDVDELLTELEQAVYTSIPNPFHLMLSMEKKEKHYATASSV